MKNRQILQLLFTFIPLMFALIMLLQGTTNVTEAFSASANDKLMFFYADWCPHCTSFKPIVKDLQNIKVEMLEDASTDSKLKEEYDIKGYPTVYYVESTRKVQFKGPRTMEGLTDFVTTCRAM